MKPFPSLRAPGRDVGLPPSREETLATLERPPGNGGRRKKSGRTEELNIRVKPGFRERFKRHASRENETVGALLERLFEEHQAGGGRPQPGVVPAAEAKAGRTAQLRVWCTPSVLHAVPKLAAARGMLVAELIEDLVAREVHRLDPHGGKFGVGVRT